MFGFPEIDAIAGAIELISQERVGRTVRERLALAARLSERISALSVYVDRRTFPDSACAVNRVWDSGQAG